MAEGRRVLQGPQRQELPCCSSEGGKTRNAPKKKEGNGFKEAFSGSG